MAVSTQPMRALLDPKGIAVVGASQQPGRGTSVVANLRDAGFSGEIVAVNPRYTDVLGYRCYPSVKELPDTIDCLVIAIPARAACDAMEQAFAHGIRAAVVLASGFDEDDENGALGTRLKALADKGMAICGPNCFGIVNVKTGAVAFNGVVPKALPRGPIALVSQSGSLGNFAFGPLIRDRKLGFSYFVSCGNQIGLTVEDYAEYFAADPDIKVIAAIVEDLKNPRKLERVAATARANGKPLVFVQIGRTAAGQVMTQSHTGALAGNAEVMAAFLRRCGIVQAESYDEFVETVALFAHVSLGAGGNDVVLVSGSGGGAALAADQLDTAGLKLAQLSDATGARIRTVLPEIGGVTNPIDVTGAVFYDASIMGRLLEAVASDESRPIIAAAVNAIPAPHDRMRRIASAIADAARNTGAPIVAYQVSPLGPLDAEFVEILHRANVPLLMGAASAMNAIKHLPRYRTMAVQSRAAAKPATAALPGSSFMDLHRTLRNSGVAVVDAILVRSEFEALDAFHRFKAPVALKAEAPGLLHKSDIGCVRLNCASEADVAAGFSSRDGERAARRIPRSCCHRSADDVRHRRSLCRHHRRSALRTGHRVRPWRYFRRGIEGYRDRDGAAVTRRCIGDDPSHQSRPTPARSTRTAARRYRGAGDTVGQSQPFRGRSRRTDQGARPQSDHCQAGRRRRCRGRHRCRACGSPLRRAQFNRGETFR